MDFDVLHCGPKDSHSKIHKTSYSFVTERFVEDDEHEQENVNEENGLASSEIYSQGNIGNRGSYVCVHTMNKSFLKGGTVEQLNIHRFLLSTP